MRISVVTVARNAADTVGDAAASVARQSYPNVEHLLIDGASTDATVARARAASPRLTRIVSERDGGIYDAMNKGIGLATGDVIGMLNADDFYAHEHVLQQVAEVMNTTENDGCYADLVYVSRKNPSQVVRHWHSGPYRSGLFARGWVAPHPTVYLRRQVYERIGRFDLRYHLAADFELLLRAFEVHRLRIRYVPNIWVHMRLGGATNRSLRNIAAGNWEIAQALRQHRAGWPLFTLTCRMLRRIPQFRGTQR